MNEPTQEPGAMNLPQVAAQLVRLSPDPIAEVATGLLLPLSQNLKVIIGRNGFKALLDWSVHATAKQHPWLVAAEDSSDRFSGPEDLASVLGQQDANEARQAMVLLLATLLELLVTLIGQALTLKLLSSSWGAAFDRAVQETQK